MRVAVYSSILGLVSVSMAASSIRFPRKATHPMLRKRLLDLNNSGSNDDDTLSPLTDTLHASSFSQLYQNGPLAGSSGPTSLINDDVLAVAPTTQSIDDNNNGSPLPAAEGLSLRPRHRTHLRRSAMAIAARQLLRQRQLEDSTSGLTNDLDLEELTDMTGLDLDQATGSGSGLLGGVEGQGLAGGIKRRRSLVHSRVFFALPSPVEQDRAALAVLNTQNGPHSSGANAYEAIGAAQSQTSL